MLKHKMKPWKVVSIAILLIMALLSVTLIGQFTSSPQFYGNTIKTLDAQKQDAMTLSIVVTAASTALSTLPEDVASPVADELADLSLPLFAIVCILYMEKFLLTTLGWFSTTFLFPAACLLLITYICSHKEVFFVWTKKFLILAVVLLLLVPISAKVTTMIETTFSESVSQTMEAAFQLAEETETASGEKTNAFVAFFASLKDNVVSLVNAAKNMLSLLVDAVAVLMITSCVIPVLTMLLFLWVVKLTINVDIPVKNLALLVRPVRRRFSKPEQKTLEQKAIEQ